MKFKFCYANEHEWRRDIEISTLKQLKKLCKETQRYVVEFYGESYTKKTGYDGEIIVYNYYLE